MVGRIQMIQQPDDVENHANHTGMKKNRSLRLVVALEFGGAVQWSCSVMVFSLMMFSDGVH